MSISLISFISGLVFAIGMGISGMTQPANVIGFLDFFGNWNPSLAFVMLGAIGVYSISYRLILKKDKPLLDNTFKIPTGTDLSSPLIIGAVLFGIGWGIAGFCPAPAVVSLGGLSINALIFVFFMLIGMLLNTVYQSKRKNNA